MSKNKNSGRPSSEPKKEHFKRQDPGKGGQQNQKGQPVQETRPQKPKK